ncbi:MAG: DUF2279 domain-containing protein [Sphingomonadales bacterium]|nr:DUF2279 domain-containing protein [Sphingomonadales bacterium]
MGTHAILYHTWYKNEPMSPFHWINDNHSWKQMDKVGHVFGAYFSATATSAVFRYSGYSRKKSALLGSVFSLAFQMPIEYFDGKSRAWGASSGDMIANATGTLAAGLQNWFWGKPRIPIRVTFHKSSYAHYRPNMLGSSVAERILKDYNGQTYWIDLNPERIRMRPNFWPRWLGLNLGYGAEGMLGGDDNIWKGSDGKVYDYSYIKRYRQYYLGPSISLGYLKNHPNKAVRVLAHITDKIRLPLPVIEYNGNKQWVFHPLYW